MSVFLVLASCFNEDAQAVYYTVMKHHYKHLRTQGKCRKHQHRSVFSTFPVFENTYHVSSQFNIWLRLLCLFNMQMLSC